MDRISLSSIKEEEFDSLTFDSSTPSLVFFGTRKCKICKEQMPIVEEIAFEYRDKLNAYWVDVDKYKPLFYRFRLQGIPNILLFDRGEVRERIRGLNSKDTLLHRLDTVLFSGN